MEVLRLSRFPDDTRPIQILDTLMPLYLNTQILREAKGEWSSIYEDGVVCIACIFMMERYEILKDIGSGNFGVAKLVKDKSSGDLFAVKYIDRGQKMKALRPASKSAISDILSHRFCIRSPNQQSGHLRISPQKSCRKKSTTIADVWSCGVTLYVMLVGAYPFEDPDDPRNFRKTLARITILEIKKHPWFVKNMTIDVMEDEESGAEVEKADTPSQSTEEVIAIIQEARKSPMGSKEEGEFVGMDLEDEIDSDDEFEDDVDTSGDFVCAL
ncbi:hypothetical protein Ccrd_018561 [Cynara cardunculus var. scolymus]|uniref:Protein kinase domain-containing protein n=1 Tax=Cynara cardunculus var. scolymus TaxID=59895 RepID=A0A103Y610_CYNCS|nr:hypothetical protein Ccrd_018561 [Cynara cardunculus var. scolymus]